MSCILYLHFGRNNRLHIHSTIKQQVPPKRLLPYVKTHSVIIQRVPA